MTAIIALVCGSGLLVSSGAQATTQASQPAGLDHFLCYTATAAGFRAPPGVTLVNQLAPNGFTPAIGAVNMHCNPALKIVPGAQFPPQSPDWHLLCWRITATQPTHTVVVTNQFGSAQLDTSSPTQLCLPSLKSIQNPPVFPTPSPSEITPDHFTCYPVTYSGTTRFRPPAPVQVADQFSPAGPVQVKVKTPKMLCVPTKKVINGVVMANITNPAAHLLCFGVSPTPIVPTVFDKNQFGIGKVSITQTKLLCLPSFKQLIR